MEDFKNVSNNIRKYRKGKDLTQAQLADLLAVTSQNVSKWEKGLSMPDIGNLWKLAQLFSIPLEELLGVSAKAKRRKAMIAIDGGGTKTEFVLFEPSGEIVKREIMGGTNINSFGLQGSFAILKAGIENMLLEGYEVTAVYAGIAGCGVEDNRKKTLSFLRKNFPDLRIDVRSDLTNVMNSSIDCNKMIAVICGTGSVVCAKTSNSTHRVGGWGYAFDSGGSGYDFGRDAICAALAERDGFGEKTLITELVEAKLNGNVTDKIGTIYANGKDYIASFAGIVFQAYTIGDKVAVQIVNRNMDRICYLIECAAKMYDCGKTVVISGGLVAQRDILERVIKERADKKLKFIFNDVPPIVGAGVCCIRSFFDSKIDAAQFRRIFFESYKRQISEVNYAQN